MMTMKSSLILPCLGVLLLACTPAEPDLAENLPLPGSDRDEHGCIGSAGYVWSEERGECICLWEVDAENVNEVGEDAIREYGRVASFEDSVYPMFNMTMEFPERGTTEMFSFNIMELDYDETALTDLVGTYTTIYYTSELEADLIDMKVGGVSILEDGFDMEDAKTITGVLSGADAPTMSDLPGEFVITDTDGEAIHFEYYITDAMAAANGKTVSASYVLDGRNTITKIMPPSEQTDE
jgi:hypothetical protein